MENQKMMKFAEDVVTEEIRKGKLVRSKEILETLPRLIATVHIDKRKMRGSIERCLSSSDPLNAVLRLFGVQIIRREKTINSMLNSGTEQNDVSDQIDDSNAKHWLTLDDQGFKAIVEDIAQLLFELESQANQAYDDEKMRGDNLFEKYEKLLKEHNELKYNAETNEKSVAERIQYMLSAAGKDAEADNEQLVELLKDLSIDVYWESSEAPFADAAMFTEYAVDDEVIASVKPCLVRNGSVYVKGMRFIKK